MFSLKGQVALVTGAARGQGAAIAAMLASRGAKVVAADICADVESVPYPLATVANLDSVVEKIKLEGGDAEGVIVDIRERAQCVSLVKKATELYGSVDILVANAGVCVFTPLPELDPEVWATTIDTNLTSVFHLVQCVLPKMTENSYGRIVTIASGAGRMGMQELSHYAASKWGLIGLTKSVAAETASNGITANVVAPTAVDTPMIVNATGLERHFPSNPSATKADLAEKFRSSNPMGKAWLQPEDVAHCVEFLVGEPGNISGAVFEVNLATSASRT